MHRISPNPFKLSAALVAATLFALPAQAISIITGDPNSLDVTYGRPVGGVNLSGVVMIQSVGIGGCSGELLADGFSILTAGHCVSSAYGGYISPDITISFMTPSGFVTQTVATVSVDPGWNGDATQGQDLAVLTLASLAPDSAARYSLYTGNPVTAPLVIAGYGYAGTGASGSDPSTYPFGTLRAGVNEYAATGTTFGFSSNLLIGQFYDAADSSTNSLSLSHPFSAANEVDIDHGDSGGPSFYNGQIIGVHDQIICLITGSGVCAHPNDSYAGQLFADTSVSATAGWINAQMVGAAVTPEPATTLLFVTGLIGLAVYKQRA